MQLIPSVGSTPIKAMGALALALGLWGQNAMATEEPAYETLSVHGSIELRRYAPYIVAETTVEGDMDAASGKGFRAIADYIFGNNVAVASSTAQGSEKIAMTAPVTLEPLSPATGAAAPAASQKIAMTAPVGLQPLPSADSAGANPPRLQGAQRWRVHFVMPAGYTLATLPKPNNPAVRLREVPATTWAVLRYSGVNTEAVVQQRTEELMAWLAERNTQTVGSPQLARYNPPWTLPMFRRNEIMWQTE